MAGPAKGLLMGVRSSTPSRFARGRRIRPASQGLLKKASFIGMREEYMDHSCWNGSTLAFRIEEQKNNVKHNGFKTLFNKASRNHDFGICFILFYMTSPTLKGQFKRPCLLSNFRWELSKISYISAIRAHRHSKRALWGPEGL